MPTYDYQCQACGHEVEIFHAMTEQPRKKCPACGKNKLQRQIGLGAGIIFKGSGFYETDYKRKEAGGQKEDTSGGSNSGEGNSNTSANQSKDNSSSEKSTGSSKSDKSQAQKNE